jgi:ubiquinone/menaquinone biosynthesis C-methylase UbiE
MEINFLKDIPKSNRNIEKRLKAKDPEVIKEAKKFGKLYWDGPRDYGYGGYKYDGRWISVAKNLISHYSLTSGMKVLDIGCGKGFLVKDLMSECNGLDVIGLDISKYALLNADDSLTGRLHHGNAKKLIFPSSSFDLVVSFNTLHNLNRNNVIIALEEIVRVSKGAAFVQVDSYLNDEQKKIFESWVLTAKFHDYPEGWKKIFKKANYKGDYFWTIIN